MCLAVRSGQILRGNRKASVDRSVIFGVVFAFIIAVAFRQQSARRAAELLILAGPSFILSTLGRLDLLHEEAEAQRSGMNPGSEATRLFFRFLLYSIAIVGICLFFARGW
jgi:hypothetical protein